MSKKKEFGDFQTPIGLADKVVQLLFKIGINPDVIIEPTAGTGAFLQASIKQWKEKCHHYFGYEINPNHVNIANARLNPYNIKVKEQDFFLVDWKKIFGEFYGKDLLVIGNPPWVTNSELSAMQSSNLPRKSNFQNLSGLEAKTGKSNFDIAEWMIVNLFDSLDFAGNLAMLCKTITARKVLKHIWKKKECNCTASLYNFDANKEFGVAVDACLFVLTKIDSKEDCEASVFEDFDIEKKPTKFGIIDGMLVADVETCKAHADIISGLEDYKWRSGIKHDAAKVMEFTRDGHCLINGFGESVELEDTYIYPLLKSSDIGNKRLSARKSVLVPQSHTGENTSLIAHNAPKTWDYLNCYKNILDNRRSFIYNKRPPFSIFGVGEYSFSNWKVAISGLYKNPVFSVVSPENGRPVMLDDTCYFLPCSSQSEAQLICDLLTSELAQDVIRSLVFMDSKRPITIEVLRQISLFNLAISLGKQDVFDIIQKKCFKRHQLTLPFVS